MARRRGQLSQDAALAGLLGFTAVFPQGFELSFQRLQLLDAGGHMADVLVEQVVHLGAVLVRRVLEEKQHSDFAQRHVQPSAVPNEGQSLNMFAAVHAEITFCTWRFWQQSFAFVIPDRLDLGVSGLGQFADFHIFTFSGGGLFPSYCRHLTLQWLQGF